MRDSTVQDPPTPTGSVGNTIGSPTMAVRNCSVRARVWSLAAVGAVKFTEDMVPASLPNQPKVKPWADARSSLAPSPASLGWSNSAVTLREEVSLFSALRVRVTRAEVNVVGDWGSSSGVSLVSAAVPTVGVKASVTVTFTLWSPVSISR